MLQWIKEEIQISPGKTIEDHESCDGAIVQSHRETTHHGQDSQFYREEVHEHQSKPEDGHGDSDQSHDHGEIVKEGILPDSRNPPSHDSNKAGNENGGD